MNEALLVSNLPGGWWCRGVVAALVRQVGVLYERVAPPARWCCPKAWTLRRGARDRGGGAGRWNADDRRPAAAHRSTLVFFLSPSCPVCKQLLPALRSVARAEASWLDVVLASDGTRVEHEAYVARERLDDFPYVLSAPLGVAYRVGKLPYAVLIDGDGVVRGAGLVNSREHLESLFEAKERGVASIQDYLEGARA